MDKEEALKRLKIEKLFNQILFHTEKSLEYCMFNNFEDLGGKTPKWTFKGNLRTGVSEFKLPRVPSGRRKN